MVNTFRGSIPIVQYFFFGLNIFQKRIELCYVYCIIITPLVIPNTRSDYYIFRPERYRFLDKHEIEEVFRFRNTLHPTYNTIGAMPQKK